MIYAKVGEEITCENGHLVAVFLRDVHVGDHTGPGDLEWHGLPEPGPADLIPVCPTCGAAAFRGMARQAHFKDGWRSVVNP